VFKKGRYLKQTMNKNENLLNFNRGFGNERQDALKQIQNTQSRIGFFIKKIHEEDIKEGQRIIREFNFKKSNVDLEFYLSCVLGLEQAEKIFYRNTLKIIPK